MKNYLQKTTEVNNILSRLIVLSLLSTVLIQFFIQTPLYTFARLFLYLMMLSSIVLFFFQTNVKIEKNLKICFFLAFLSILNSLIILLLKNDPDGLSLSLQVVLSLAICYLGYNIKLSRVGKEKLLLKYIILATVLGLFIVSYYGSGFNILDQYFIASKNQIGPFIAGSIVLTLVILKNRYSEFNTYKQLGLIVCLVCNTMVLLTLRNRSGIVGIIVCIIIYILSNPPTLKKKITKKTIFFFGLFFIVIGIGLYQGLFQYATKYLLNSLFLNYDITDVNSLSADRTDTYILVFEHLRVAPFFGELTSYSGISGTPHNYLFNILLQFGIIGLLPLLILYFFVGYQIFKSIVLFRSKEEGLYLMFFMFLISMFEYSYPYSPLTTVSLSWFLFGNYLQPTSK